MLMWTKLLITVLDLLFNLNICPHTSTVINFWTRLVVSSWAAGVTTKPCPHRPCPKLSTLYMQRPLTIFFCYYFCRWRIDRLHHPMHCTYSPIPYRDNYIALKSEHKVNKQVEGHQRKIQK